MRPGMYADHVAGSRYLPERARILLGVQPNNKKCCVHLAGAERTNKLRRKFGRPVVECQVGRFIACILKCRLRRAG